METEDRRDTSRALDVLVVAFVVIAAIALFDALPPLLAVVDVKSGKYLKIDGRLFSRLDLRGDIGAGAVNAGRQSERRSVRHRVWAFRDASTECDSPRPLSQHDPRRVRYCKRLRFPVKIGVEAWRSSSML